MNRAELSALSTEALGEGFSDCYKSLNGVRPRFQPSREYLIEFWAGYDETFERVRAEEDYWEAIYAEEAAARQAIEAAEDAEAEAMAEIAAPAERAYQMGVSVAVLDGWV